LILFPRALSNLSQSSIARAALRKWIEPPAARNVDAFLGVNATQPPPRSWRSDLSTATTSSPPSLPSILDTTPLWPAWRKARLNGTPSVLNELAWSSLGARYNWDSRIYERANNTNPPPPLLPTILSQIASTACIAAAAAAAVSSSSLFASTTIPASNSGILNVYKATSLVGTRAPMRAHSDDANGEMFEAPVISLSLGASAIFLLEKIGGGDGGDVSAILLRSGDVAILGGESRGARHGVARVFSSGGGDDEGEKLFNWDSTTVARDIGKESDSNISDDDRDMDTNIDEEEEKDFYHFFQKRRISITLRTVR